MRHTTPPCRVRGRITLVLAMMEDVYTNSYYCKVKDEYTTNHYRLLDIPTTSSSRMQDIYTTTTLMLLLRRRYREGMEVTKELLLNREVEVTQELTLNRKTDTLKQLPLTMEMEVAINPSQYCQSALPSTFSTSQYCQLVLIKTSTQPAPRASYQTPGTQAGHTPACTAELLNVS